MKIKMDVKAEVLSKNFKTDEDFQRFLVKFVIESFEANILSEDMMNMNLDPNRSVSSPRRRHLTSSRECNYLIRMEQTYSKSRRMIVTLL